MEGGGGGWSKPDVRGGAGVITARHDGSKMLVIMFLSEIERSQRTLPLSDVVCIRST